MSSASSDRTLPTDATVAAYILLGVEQERRRVMIVLSQEPIAFNASPYMVTRVVEIVAVGQCCRGARSSRVTSDEVDDLVVLLAYLWQKHTHSKRSVAMLSADMALLLCA